MPSQAPWAVWTLLEAVQSQAGSMNRRKCNCIKGSQYFLKYKNYYKLKLFYIHIGILGRSTDHIYIYINVVIAYYAKEDNG